MQSKDIFLSLLRLYKTTEDLTSSESVFNHVLVHRFLEAVAMSTQNKHNCGSDFVPGEAYLSAITKQLKDIGNYKDDRYQYKADGIIKMARLRNLEILLLETSGPFRSIDKTKSSFDHHKGTFGALAMLKSIADEYNYGSMDIFVNGKVFFVHAAESSVHLWSLCYKEEGIYEFWREDSLDIRPLFDERQDMISDVIRFYWMIKKSIEESLDKIILLRESHDAKKKEFRYSDLSPPLLTDVVNPAILALNQKHHSKGMAKQGPY